MERVGQNGKIYNFQVVPKVSLGYYHAPLFIPPNSTLLTCISQHPIVPLQILFLVLNLSLGEVDMSVPRVEVFNHHVPCLAAPPILASMVNIVIFMK